MKAHIVIPETMSEWDFAQIITHKCSGRRENTANSTITKAVSQYVPTPRAFREALFETSSNHPLITVSVLNLQRAKYAPNFL